MKQEVTDTLRKSYQEVSVQ